MKSKRKIWRINTAQIAEFVRKKPQMVRKDIHSGYCNPDDLGGFARYLLGERWKSERDK